MGGLSSALGFVSGAPFLGSAASVVGGWLGYKGTQDTNTANRDIAAQQLAHSAQEAQKLREYQTAERLAKQEYDARMSNSAVSRRMADMKNSGINPILASKYDASSPSSQAMSGGMGQLPGLPQQHSALSAGINAAQQGASTALSVKKTTSEIEVLRQEAILKSSQDLKTIYEAYLAQGKITWNTVSHEVKAEIWDIYKDILEMMTREQKQALFAAVPALAGATTLASFALKAGGVITDLIGALFKIGRSSKPLKGVGNNVRYK